MKYILIILSFIISVSSLAQDPKSRPKVHVTGKVINQESGQGLEYATLIFIPEKGKRLSGGITNEFGDFDIQVPVGSYRISVEFISFKTKELPLQKFTKDTHIGIISLHTDAESLDEIEVIAEKSTVEIKLDKKIYNVGKDMTVKGGNAADVLENVPSVNVDVEGNVSLRGNESVRILIDGKPSGLVGLSSTDALRQLPANAIEKVEVITSPSARYDAEGTAGILNIILRKNKALGFNASTNLTVGYHKNYRASANINYRSKKWNLFSNLGYNYRNAPGNAYFENTNNTTNFVLSNEFRKYTRKRNNVNAQIGIEYYITKNSSLTGSYLIRNTLGDTNVDNNNFKYDNQNIELESYRNEMEEEEDRVTEYAFNFTQKFKGTGHRLTFDAKYQDSYEDENSFITDKDVYPGTTAVSLEKTATLESQKRFLLKGDYVLPIGEDKQFEAGFQSNSNTTNTDFKVETNINGEYVINKDVSNVLNYKENIYALYSQYGSKWGKLSALLGLRMEITDIDVKVAGLNLDNNKKHTQLFPTLNLTYELNDSESLTLGYNRRIRRPRSRHINPFQTRSSTNNIFKGNPDLNPVFTDAIEVGHLKKWDELTLNTSVYYQYADNVFQFVRYDSGEVTDSGLPIIIATPINLNTENRYGVELSLNYNPSRALRFSNSFNFYRFKTNGSYQNIDYSSKNQSWFNRFNARIRLFKKVDFQTTLFYRGPYENAVTKRAGILVANLALSRDILNDKATLSLNVQDLFNSRVRKLTSYYEKFNSYVEFQWRERQINLSFTYRFKQKKKRGRQRGNFEEGDNFEG